MAVDKGFAAALLRHLTPIANVPFSGFCAFRDWPKDQGVSFVAIPLLWRSSLLGAIVLQHGQPRSYKENDLRLLSTVGYILGAELRMLELQKRNSELELELETRKLVERGKGILQRDLGITAQEAFQALQRQSEEKRRPLKDIAQAVILNSEVRQSASVQAH